MGNEVWRSFTGIKSLGFFELEALAHVWYLSFWGKICIYKLAAWTKTEAALLMIETFYILISSL